MNAYYRGRSSLPVNPAKSVRNILTDKWKGSTMFFS